MKREKGFMSWPVLNKIINFARNRAKTCYMHQIGEPLLHPQLIDMINYVAGADIRTSISTNAMVLTETMAELILKSKLHELTICLDSLDKRTYESLRCGANFDKVLRNIMMFFNKREEIENNLFVEMQLIVMKENVHEVPAFVKWFEPLVGEKGRLNIKGYSTFAGKVDDKAPSQTPSRREKCRKAFNSLGFNWNGDIILCCRDYDSFTVLGNVLQDDLMSVWRGEKLEAIRDGFRKKEYIDFCSNC
jgi:MoaA/NifB/PqqE/SkfB family radical SAM enzyme